MRLMHEIFMADSDGQKSKVMYSKIARWGFHETRTLVSASG
jgi:hypothetical protein